MNQEFKNIFAIFLIAFIPFQNIFGQDNLKVEFENPSSVPDFLNICGEADTATVRVSLNGLSPDARTNIAATLELFKGVELSEFITAESSAGVSLDNMTDPNAPIFGIPDLDPSGTTFVDITFTIAAKCEYIDTLTANNAIQVQNNWKFNYELGGPSLEENDLNTEYRDAFAVPSFTAVVNNTHGAARSGECFSRDVVLTNSGLDGFVDGIAYSNRQGRGVFVDNIEVNGVALTITKTPLVNGDTLIEGTIDATHFVNNTIGGGAGNGDGNLDPNETVTITENICLLNCLESRASIHTMSWGCEGRYCNTSTTTDFIQIGQGAANVLVEDSGTIANDNAGYCQDGVSTVTFTNNGVEVDAGFGAMVNLEAGIGLGNGFLLSDGGFNITQIRIAGVIVPLSGSLFMIDDNPLFAVDPDGAGVGLEDLDGDLFFDDLGVGESFEITADYEMDCSIAQLPGDNGNCDNDYGTSFSARVDYDNACEERIVRLQGNYFRPGNNNSRTGTSTIPDAYVEQDTFYIVQTIDRSVSRFEKNCGGQEVFQTQIKLPLGVTAVLDSFWLKRNDGSTPIPILSNNISNDTLYLVFDAASIPFINGDYELRMAFEADCSADLDFVQFPYEFAFYCPPCDCRHIWHCDTLQGPKLHADIPPCPPLTFVCPVGLNTRSFDVERTTFGYTDATYTTDFDPDLANKSVAISCDSIEMKIVNIVGDANITDSIGMVITYTNPNREIDDTQTFLFDEGTVRFTNGGNEYFCSFDTTILSIETIDSIQILTFDLNDCLTSLGLTLTASDTIEFLGNFSLNADGPVPPKFTSIPEFRAYGYGTVNGTDEFCDNFGEIFQVAKNQTAVNFPSSSQFPTGCEEVFLDYNLLTVNNGFSDYFGNEYRQAIGIDSIVFDYDPAILDAFSAIETSISIPGHPIYGNSYYTVQGFDESDNGHYVALFDTLQSVPALNNVQSYSFSFRVRIIPNCESILGSSNGDNQYNFDPQIYFKDRYYATEIGDGSCAEDKFESQDNDIFYTDPPVLNLTTASAPNFNLAGDTAYWDLQFCNTSFNARAGLTWLGIEDPTGAIEVVEMIDITDPLTPVTYAVSTYGSVGNNYFAYANPLEIGNSSATFDDICNVVRVKALVNQCGVTNFQARIGWNCIAFTKPDWTPELYPPCDDETQALSVTPLDPSLDANIVEQPVVDPDICDTNTIAILVRNTGLGTAYDINTQIILPMQGAAILSGSVQFAYPSGSAFQSIGTDPSFMTTTSRGDIYEYTGFSNLNTFLNENGLPGFDPLNPSDSNEFIIRYKFVTDCDFMSGSISYYALQGMKNCGDSTNYETGETLPIEINGAAPGLDKIFTIGFLENSILIPNESSTLEIKFQNLTTTLTDGNDLISLMLPEGVTYDLNSSVASLPASWTIGEPDVEVNGGFQMLFWQMPIGLAQFDSAVFTLNVTTPDLDCAISNMQAGLNTIQRKILSCAETASNCDVDAITSVNNGALSDLDVRQNTLSINLGSVTSMCSGVDEETIQFSGAIQNLGSDFPAVPFDVEYFFDQDGSGDISIGDPMVLTITENGPIAEDDALIISHSIPVTDNQVCGILVRIDSTGLGLCDIAEIALGEPQLLNAGNDQIFCEIAATTITANLGDPTCGSLSNYTYNWLAISPASTGDLSATNIPNPVLTVNHNATTQDTLQYILQTNRPNCSGSTRDTISVIRALGISVDGGPTVYVQPGGSTTLSPTVNGGFAPFTYNWSPVATLDDGSSSNPIASPLGDTDYSVTVTSASGCTEVNIVEVRVGGAVTISVQPYDTIICAEEMIPLTASGGTAYTWQEVAGNPSSGNLSAYDIPNPSFSNGLPSSTYNYKVIVEDLAFPGFFDTADVVIQTLAEPNVDIASSSTTFVCGGDEAILTASGAQTYIWENVTNNTQIGTGEFIIVMSSEETTYQVTGTDSLGCLSTEEITLSVNQGTVAEIFSAPAMGCNGETILLVGGTGDFYEWFENGSSIGTNDSIEITPTATSTYMLVVENTVGCLDTTEVTIEITDCPCDPIDVASIITVESTCGNSTGEANINLVADPTNYSFTWSPDLGTPNTEGNIRTNLPFGGYSVVIENMSETNCRDSVFLIIQNSDGPSATSITTPATCALADGTASLSPDTLNFLWENNTTDAVRNDLTAGVHFVTISDSANPSCPNVMMVVVGAENPLEASLTINQAPDCGSANGSATINVTGGSGTYNYSWDTGVATGTNLSSGFYSVTITDTDATGCELVYDFVLTDNVPPATVAIDSINETSCTGAIDGQVYFSINYDLAFVSPADTLITDGFEEFENGNLPAGDYCIIISDANDCVAGEACFTIESAETLELNFTVIPDCNIGGVIELEVQGGTPPYIFDWADLPGISDEQNRDSLAFGIYDLAMMDSLGCLVNYAVIVPPCDTITPSTFCDSIFIGQTDTFLIDISQLPGNPISLENFCLDLSGTEVEFFEDFNTFSVEYTGLELGIDSACIVICDDLGYCDTTYLCISVIEYLGPPILYNDKDSVDIGFPVVVNVHENDLLYGGVDSMYIDLDPIYGDVSLNLDGSITYNAGQEYCERIDSFTYVVCNSNACDTATVCIFIKCVDIVIFNAVSPNGDGINDVFYISKIEDFPNNNLKIYNRWGNLVFETVGYNNDWGGTFNNKRELPDGTYYYVLELNSPDDDRIFQGYLEIYR